MGKWVVGKLGTADGCVDAVMAVFPGSRLWRRRTPDEHARFWDGLTRQADARKRAETIGTATLERLELSRKRRR